MSNLHKILKFLIEPICLNFGGKTPPAMGTPPPPPKTPTVAARTAAEAFVPKNGRASTILSPRFNNTGDSGKKTILGTPL